MHLLVKALHDTIKSNQEYKLLNLRVFANENNFYAIFRNLKKKKKEKIHRYLFMTSKVKEITSGKRHLFKLQIPYKSRLVQKYGRSEEKQS